jgi:hypothetical protein
MTHYSYSDLAFLEFLRSQDEELIRLGLGFVQLALAFIPQVSLAVRSSGNDDSPKARSL